MTSSFIPFFCMRMMVVILNESILIRDVNLRLFSELIQAFE